jgi:hypothetical protein
VNKPPPRNGAWLPRQSYFFSFTLFCDPQKDARRWRESAGPLEPRPRAADVCRSKLRRFLATKWPGGDGVCPDLTVKDRRGRLLAASKLPASFGKSEGG